MDSAIQAQPPAPGLPAPTASAPGLPTPAVAGSDLPSSAVAGSDLPSSAVAGSGLREPGLREPGLRERKKAATRQALHEAAVRLSIDHGPDRITVEAVADAAGVSRRTFSNYFANKEEALLYGDHVRMRLLLDAVHARPVTEQPWTALTRSADDFYARLGERDPHWVAQSRLVRTHPSLLAQQVATFAALERELAAEVARRMTGPDPSGMRARLTAAAFMAGLRVAVHVWLDRAPGIALSVLVQQALADIGERFD